MDVCEDKELDNLMEWLLSSGGDLNIPLLTPEKESSKAGEKVEKIPESPNILMENLGPMREFKKELLDEMPPKVAKKRRKATECAICGDIVFHE